MNDRPVVVVLGTGPEDPPPGIEAAAADVELRYARDGAALPDALGGADALFFWRAEGAWLRDAWPHADRLRWVQSASDGVDALMFPELVASEVEVTNARGVFEDAIAEWVIGAMLAFAARILDQRDRQTRGVWDSTTRERLAGSRLLVVGPGPIGRATAVRARALGMEVEAAGRASRQDDLFGAGRRDRRRRGVPRRARPRRSRARCPPADARDPRALRRGRVRGDATDGPLLQRGAWCHGRRASPGRRARAGGIAGAGLDVFVEEPLPEDSPLWAMPQVLLSPHMCGDVEGWEAEVVSIFVDNAARFARGEPLRNRVDTSAGFGVG